MMVVPLPTHVCFLLAGVDTPMGWMALFCALPMWATSVNWVRRKYYSLFKLAHWLFMGVFVFGVMHVGGFYSSSFVMQKKKKQNN